MEEIMSGIARAALGWLIRQVFQVTSFGAYAVGVWAWMGFDPSNLDGIKILQTAIEALAALALFVFNERPWISKLAK